MIQCHARLNRFPAPRRSRRLLLSMLWTAVCVSCVALVGADSHAVLDTTKATLRDADPVAPPLPAQTRIAVHVDAASGASAARVTLVFPHNGFAVTDWGAPEREGNRIGVDVTVERRPGMLPVVTEFSHRYDLGVLAPGDYGFEVSASGEPLAGEKFTVPEGPVPPPVPPASARLWVTVFDDGTAVARVEVAFSEPGYRVVDWGEPTRRGNYFSIRAKAARIAERPGPADTNTMVLVAGHSYPLWPGPLPPGDYKLEFFLNTASLAASAFHVPGHGGSVALHAGPLTKPGQPTHPVRVVYRHPEGIETDSLSDRNIRVVGPDGYDRHATFEGWIPLKGGGTEVETEATEGLEGVVATYLVHAPGRVWTSRDNGIYAVLLTDGTVRTGGGGAFAGRRLGRFEVKISADPVPWITFHSLRVGKISGSGEITAETDRGEYGAKLTLLVGSTGIDIDWGDVHREGNRFWVDVEGRHDSEVSLPVVTPRSHLYRMGSLEAGRYLFQVFAHGRHIGGKRFSVSPENLPMARVIARDIKEATPDPHLFQIRYHSPHGMDMESIRRAGIRVRGPHGYAKSARLLSLDTFATAEGRRFVQATHAVDPPRGGWTARANGTYGVFVPDFTIRDMAGHFVAGGRAGGFAVMIRPAPPSDDRPRLDLETEEDSDGVILAHLRFLPGASGWAVTHWGEEVHMKGFAFLARAEIDENPSIRAVEFRHTYRLGRLSPGVYRFVWYGSNGFVSRHLFRVEGDDLARPFQRWRDAYSRFAGERGHPYPEDTLESEWLFHYAFSGNPGHSFGRESPSPRFERGGDGAGRFVLEYTEEPFAVDVERGVELSADLRAWVDAAGMVRLRELRENLDGSRTRVLEIRAEEDGSAYRFVRLRASLGGETPLE